MTFVLDPNVVSRSLDEERVLVHLETGWIYTLNRTAARFWDLAGEGLPRREIERRMLAELDVGEAELRGEIDRMIAELAAAQLLSLQPEGHGR